MRRRHDAYYTPPWQTALLLSHQPISGRVVEPCCGDGAIVRLLRGAGCAVTTGDIDPAVARVVPPASGRPPRRLPQRGHVALIVVTFTPRRAAAHAVSSNGTSPTGSRSVPSRSQINQAVVTESVFPSPV